MAGALLARRRHPRLPARIPHQESRRTRKPGSIDTERRRGEFIDPDAGTITLAEWTATWFEGLDLAPTTLAQYRSLAHTHILPRWGTTALGDITGTAVNVWAEQAPRPRLRRLHRHHHPQDPHDDPRRRRRRAPHPGQPHPPATPRPPPPRHRHRGGVGHPRTSPARWRCNAARLTTPDLGLLLITAAWTGARWGELTGLHRDNLHLQPNGTGSLIIDPRVGALHEVDRLLTVVPNADDWAG